MLETRLASTDKRITALSIDYCICSLLSVIFTTVLIKTDIITMYKISYEELPFMMMNFIIFSFILSPKLIFSLIMDVDYMNKFPIQSVFLLCIPLIELFYFILSQFLFKRTIGEILQKIIVISSVNKELPIFSFLVRSILKVLSKYMLFIPFIFALFTKKKQTLYDIICKSVVIEN
ncbi:hypothetical protein FACS1894132_13200 [Clostridia bacterium]|nr:hypothetical protein FACS1894132_13200 [Clostridia bacterium]